ncbi:MAG: hypothetical protein HS130_00975 [Deltaproteobacteria bacterium]|nr:hypothetical protein [Deltaproteobacteria bacterium]
MGYTMNQSARSRRRPGAFNIFVGRPGVGLKKLDRRITITSALLQQAEQYKSASSKHPLGIWERHGRGLIPLIIFVKKAPMATQRLDFYGRGEEFVKTEFPKIFGRVADETLEHWKAKG